MKAVIEDGTIVLRLPFFQNFIAKSAGARWHPATKTWRCSPNPLVAALLTAALPREEISDDILILNDAPVAIPNKPDDFNEFVRGVTLRPRQVQGLNKAWDRNGYALFWVMGAGKTLATIALAGARFDRGLIQRLLVVCPTSIKGVWAKELNRYAKFPVSLYIHESGKTPPRVWHKPDEERPLLIMVAGIESLSAGSGESICKEFLTPGNAMVVLDESSRIKHHDSGRTKASLRLSQLASFRLALTGTNATQGIQDLYTQMHFVDPMAIGEISYYSFRSRYCVMGGFQERKIVGYTRVDTLLNKIAPYSDTIRKSDMKDLPPKLYQTRKVSASKEQLDICKSLRRDLKMKLSEDREHRVKNVLEAMLRAQQVAGGFDHTGEPLRSNPKLDELMDLLEEFDGKAVIWARFLPEVAAIVKRLNERYDRATVVLTGAVPPADRQPLIDRFQADDKIRFFVSSQTVGGAGVTLTAATLAVYYSNTFNLEDRLQSEDRNHRLGQANSCLYVDLTSNLQVDRTIAETIGNKLVMSKFVADTLANSGEVDSLI